MRVCFALQARTAAEAQEKLSEELDQLLREVRLCLFQSCPAQHLPYLGLGLVFYQGDKHVRLAEHKAASDVFESGTRSTSRCDLWFLARDDWLPCAGLALATTGKDVGLKVTAIWKARVEQAVKTMREAEHSEQFSCFQRSFCLSCELSLFACRVASCSNPNGEGGEGQRRSAGACPVALPTLPVRLTHHSVSFELNAGCQGRSRWCRCGLRPRQGNVRAPVLLACCLRLLGCYAFDELFRRC